jgi:hypothetical protein
MNGHVSMFQQSYRKISMKHNQFPDGIVSLIYFSVKQVCTFEDRDMCNWNKPIRGVRSTSDMTFKWDLGQGNVGTQDELKYRPGKESMVPGYVVLILQKLERYHTQLMHLNLAQNAL